jgi:hypothetical protein
VCLSLSRGACDPLSLTHAYASAPPPSSSSHLIRVDVAGRVGVRRHLPAGAVDGFEPSPHGLDGLAARQRAQGRDEGLLGAQLPQLLRAALGQGVLDEKGAAQLVDILL